MAKKPPTKPLTARQSTILFGSAPVLSSEQLTEYETSLTAFNDCIKPRDFVEQMLVKDLADVTWEIKRYRSHKTMVIEREHLRHQEMETKRRQYERKMQLEWRKERQAAKEAEQGEKAKQPEHASAPTTQSERALELEAVVYEGVSDVDEILLEPADEIDHAKALQSGIDYYERLDRLETVAWARRDDVLRQMEFYRQGLGSVSRRASDEIIDGEFSHSEAPPITGPNPDNGDVE